MSRLLGPTAVTVPMTGNMAQDFIRLSVSEKSRPARSELFAGRRSLLNGFAASAAWGLPVAASLFGPFAAGNCHVNIVLECMTRNAFNFVCNYICHVIVLEQNGPRRQSSGGLENADQHGAPHWPAYVTMIFPRLRRGTFTGSTESSGSTSRSELARCRQH